MRVLRGVQGRVQRQLCTPRTPLLRCTWSTSTGLCRGAQTMAQATPRGSSTDDPFNAYIDKDLTVQGAASGPLQGLTFAAKDLFDVAGHRTGFGHPLWLETHPPAEHTAPAVQALLDAGATLRGKTHMDELAYSLNGENVHYGTPGNPAAPGRIPGGSSSGSAVAVAAGHVRLALGSDTGGSVRVPAAYCGVLGIRPSWGRTDLRGARPLAPSFDSAGWFARDATILRKAGAVLLDPVSRSTTPLGRLLLAADAWRLADPDTARVLRSAMDDHVSKLYDRLGSPVDVEVAAPLADQGLGEFVNWMGVFRVCQGWEVWREHGAWVTQHTPTFGPGIKERFAMAKAITPQQLEVADGQRATIRSHLAALLGNDGVLLLPTTPGPAPLLNTPPADLDAWRTRLISLTSIAGLAGLPQVHLPLAHVDGAPVGLSLIGPHGSDEQLLELVEVVVG